MADVDTTVTLIRNRVGRFTASTDIDASIILEMAAAQARLESMPTKPWFGLTEVDDLAISAGTADYALPADFIQMAGNEFAFRLVDADDAVTFPEYTDPADAMKEFPPESTDQDLPTKFAIINNNFRFWATPDQTLTGKYWYYAKDTVPAAAGAENNWLKYYSGLLVAETCYYMTAFYLGDVARAQLWEAERNRLYNIYRNEVVAREMAIRDATPED